MEARQLLKLRLTRFVVLFLNHYYHRRIVSFPPFYVTIYSSLRYLLCSVVPLKFIQRSDEKQTFFYFYKYLVGRAKDATEIGVRDTAYGFLLVSQINCKLLPGYGLRCGK